MQSPGYPYAPPPPPKSGGFPTWVIVLLAVPAVGILLVAVMAVLAMAGVRKYISAAKSAEAVNGVSQIAMDAATAYDEERIGGPPHVLCASASSAVPASIVQVSARKYMSSPTDWTADPPNQGFSCLKFSMDSPQYYQYDYKRSGATGAAVGDGFVAEATGDLDGDGDKSSFKASGSISSKGTVERSLTVLRVNEGE